MCKIYTLSEKQIKNTTSNPILKVNYIKQDSVPDFDCLIFTSKNGVKAFSQIYPDWKKYPSFAIGQETSNEIVRLGGRHSYTNEFAYGDDFAHAINRAYRDKIFLWPRGDKMATDLKNIILSSICHDIVVYNISYNDSYQPILDKNAIIIFSSPSTVEYFMEHQQWNNNHIAVSIGNTTSKKIKEYGIDCLTSNIQSLNDSVDFAKSLIKPKVKT